MLPIRLLAHGAFALSLLAATSPAIALAPQPVSTAAFEAGVVGLSYSPKTSADGRYTVFQSFAVNLVTPVDPKAPPNIYLHDAVSNTVSLVSGIDGGNRSGDSGSDSPAISADGSTIAFISTSSNLKPGVADDADSADLFVYHRPTATLELVTRVEGGNRAAGGADYEPMAFSADGRYLVFVSGASNLVVGMSDSADTRDVFLYDRVTRGVVPVSAVEGSNTASSNAFWSAGSPSISADGNFIAFQTSATDLKPGVTDDGFGSDIYLYNRSSRALTLVSGVNGGNTTGNGSSSTPAISGDGRFVAFSTEASNLKPSVADNNGTTDIYVYNRLAPGLALVSGIDGGNTTGNGFATGSIAISADGGFIAFISTASNLKSGVSDGTAKPMSISTTGPARASPWPAASTAAAPPPRTRARAGLLASSRSASAATALAWPSSAVPAI